MSSGLSGRGGGSRASRRLFLAGAGGLVAARKVRAEEARTAGAAAETPEVEPFHGAHQGGIATPQQTHSYFAAFDLTTKKHDRVVAMLRAWTEAAARMAAGDTAAPLGTNPEAAPGDGGNVLGLSPARLTITVGFGPGLFEKDGVDRYGLAARRPAALAELPKFNGDQLEEGRSGGDLSVQACADDPQVAFHAVRELARLTDKTAVLRWAQAGFMPDTKPGETPRNLMGFRDGTNNPRPRGQHQSNRDDVPRGFDEVVWAGDEGPAWMRGGTYVVARRIRISLDHWDRSEIGFQEEVVGRHKYSGAPIGKTGEHEPLGLDRTGADGTPLIAMTAHARLGAAATNGGALIVRRAYSYNDGLTFLAERWPPWRQGMMYDAGLHFLCYQRDPRTGFVAIFDTMAKIDALNQFTTHVGSALFAVPPGVAPGEFIGQRLFETV